MVKYVSKQEEIYRSLVTYWLPSSEVDGKENRYLGFVVDLENDVTGPTRNLRGTISTFKVMQQFKAVSLSIIYLAYLLMDYIF